MTLGTKMFISWMKLATSEIVFSSFIQQSTPLTVYIAFFSKSLTKLRSYTNNDYRNFPEIYLMYAEQVILRSSKKKILI